MLAGILVGNNLCSGRIEPLVSAGMIEVPMSIDQVCDRLGVQTRQGFSELRARHANSTINEYLSVGPRQDGNIATVSFENTHISAQLIRSYRRRRRTVFDKSDKPPGLCKSVARGQPATGCCKYCARHAAETEMATREQVFSCAHRRPLNRSVTHFVRDHPADN